MIRLPIAIDGLDGGGPRPLTFGLPFPPGALVEARELHAVPAAIVARQRVVRRSLAARREIIDEYGWRNYGDLFGDHEQRHYDGRGRRSRTTTTLDVAPRHPHRVSLVQLWRPRERVEASRRRRRGRPAKSTLPLHSIVDGSAANGAIGSSSDWAR